MKFIVETIYQHIQAKVKEVREARQQQGKMLIMLPDLGERVLFNLADKLENYGLSQPQLELTLKYAASLQNNWSQSYLDSAKERGWFDERENLTYYRNLDLGGDPGVFHLVVLGGVDKVEDSASLEDFYSCAPKAIWHIAMNKTFRPWITEKATSQGIELSDNEHLTCNTILTSLYNGFGDLFSLSNWLEKLDISTVIDGKGIITIMLSNLSDFNLPKCTSFSINSKTKLAKYFDDASGFFKYTYFTEKKNRDGATKAINSIRETLGTDSEPNFVTDEGLLGSHTDIEAFLATLERYVNNSGNEEKEELLKSDFVKISDNILKFKKKGSSSSNSIKPLYGMPIEVFLTAIWLTCKAAAVKSNLEDVSEISLAGEEFKFDYLTSDIEENEERSKGYLESLIGGIDEYFCSALYLKNHDDSEVEVNSALFSGDVTCKYGKNTTPCFIFYVTVDSQNTKVTKKYKWVLPSSHQYRLATELIERAVVGFKESQELKILPSFFIRYYEELMQAATTDECNRILLHDIRDGVGTDEILINLFTAVEVNSGDPLSDVFRTLSEKYSSFINYANKRGLYRALLANDCPGTHLRQAYNDCLHQISELDDIDDSALSPLLQKAFLVVENRTDYDWAEEEYQKSGLVTVLHPALLEKVEHQASYLCTCLSYAINQALGSGGKKGSFAESIWLYYRDIAEIKIPVSALLYDESKNVTTRVRGSGLFFRIGEKDQKKVALSSQSSLEYDVSEDLSDSDIFRVNSQSKLMTRILREYLALHPHGHDGLSLIIYKNDDIQSVISSINSLLKGLADKKQCQDWHIISKEESAVLDVDRNTPYQLQITLFSESSNDADLLNFIEQWKEIWQAAETESKWKHYKRVRISLSHKLIRLDSKLCDFQQAIASYADCDLALFFDFVHSLQTTNEFKDGKLFDVRKHNCMFPILEKSFQTGKAGKRSHLLSNRQFSTSAAFERYLHHLKSGNSTKSTLVIRTGTFGSWGDVLDTAHEHANWVVCIDPNVDKPLLTKRSNGASNREIIGFGSGVGRHGEANYTISSELANFSSLRPKLTRAVSNLYKIPAQWNDNDCDLVAKKVIEIAPELSGLSLVRATGVGDEYIRDFLAYTFTRHLLVKEENTLCDTLISLDAYRHWFDTSGVVVRPDLLHLKVIEGGKGQLQLWLQLIECKMGFENDEHIKKAKEQITGGMKALKPLFLPASDDSLSLTEERPDLRYWWMQLHRLIASQVHEISDKKRIKKINYGLEHLAEGEFTIDWNASIFLFWLNTDSQKTETWWPTQEGEDVNIVKYGGQYIKQQLTECCFNESVQTKKQDNNIAVADDALFDKEPYTEPETVDEVEKVSVDVTEVDDGVSDNFEPTKTTVGDNFVSGDVNKENSNNTEEENKISSLNKVSINLENIRVLLGQDIGGHPIYWEYGHPKLTNRHMMIFGSSGQGKTYAIQCILAELAKQGRNNLIVDYTNGFLPSQLEPEANAVLDAKQHIVHQTPLPINPFLPQRQDMGGIYIEDKPIDIGGRIASVFNSVYNIGDQQSSVLSSTVTEGVVRYKENMNLDQLLELVSSKADEGEGSAKSLKSKIEPFVQRTPFASGDESLDWKAILEDKKQLCHIFQLAGMDRDVQRLIIEFLLWDLWSYLLVAGNKQRPRTLVLDEVQNLDHQDGRPLSKYLREGRKFGASLLMATQTMSNMKKSERDQLFNVAHMLFFRPGSTELQDFAKIANQVSPSYSVKEWQEKLTNLQMGECYSIGGLVTHGDEFVTTAKKIKITSLQERTLNG